MNEVLFHYDALIDENHDFFRDPPAMQGYMEKWDGKSFLDALKLDDTKTALEIGIGTGRIAGKTAPFCKKLVGIDISAKTIQRAKENLFPHKNITYICGNFLDFDFQETFDVVYSSLTFMHIEKKKDAIEKIAGLLNPDGRAVLSLDKNQEESIDFGIRKITVFPDTPQEISGLFTAAGMNTLQVIETEFAHIVVATR